MLVTTKTFAERIGATKATIDTWCNDWLSANGRPKHTEFIYKDICYVIIDRRRFVNTSKTKLTKSIYEKFVKNRAGRASKQL